MALERPDRLRGSEKAEAYSPKYVEEEFHEVRGIKLDRLGEGLGTWTGSPQGFAPRTGLARLKCGEDLCQAVTTCYLASLARLPGNWADIATPRRGERSEDCIRNTG